MTAISPTDRATQLLESPAGSALLMLADEHGLSPADLTRPDIGLFAIAQAVEQISPWNGHGHHRIRRRVDQWRNDHRLRLERLALQIISQPGIDWWWEGVDRHHQVWLPQHDAFICPEEVWELRPRDKPNRFECYVHEPRPLVSTSNAYGDLSPELAHVLSGAGDWYLEPPFIPRHVTIRPTARIREIVSPQDWHDFVRQYPAEGYHPSSPENYPGQPWGEAPGLLVPDWRAVSFDWDGVNISPWTYLVTNQVRVTSDLGWTQPWAWEGPHTVWLDWMFATVEDLPPVPEDAQQHVPHWFVQGLDFSDPCGWQMMPQNVASTFQ